MPIKIVCSGCKKTLKVEDRLAGKRVRCPNCQASITIPGDKQPSETTREESDDAFEQSLPKPPSPSKIAVSRKTEKNQVELETETSFSQDGDDYYGLGKPSETTSKDDDYRPQLSKPKKVVTERTRTIDLSSRPARSVGEASWRRHLHWLFALALVPLALSIFWKEESTFGERLEKTVQEHPEIMPGLQQLPPGADLGALFDLLPDNRLAGAHLSRRSWMHWLYALLSVIGFLALLTRMFPGATVTPSRLLITGAVTGTIGILLLLGFQWVAAATQGMNLRGRGIAVVLFYIVKFIGFSYRCALEDGNGFGLSFMGFTFGVGLCEEVCKALPIAIYLRSARDANWKGACVVGLASGIGFGVSEGLTYSSDFYNGISGFSIYLVRFVSCVALHALWSGCVAQLMFRNQDHLDEFSWETAFGFVLYYLSIAMILHGVYDTLLKQEQHMWALAIAASSFGWFIWMISRQTDD